MEAVGGQEEPLNRRADPFDAGRLAQAGRPDGRQKLGRLRTHRTAGHEHDPARLIGVATLELAIEGGAVELGHPDVDHHQVESLIGEECERLDAVRRARRAVTVARQDVLEQLGEHRIVVDDQDRLHAHHANTWLPWPSTITPEPGIRENPYPGRRPVPDRKSTRLNSSHGYISYAVFCLKKKK